MPHPSQRKLTYKIILLFAAILFTLILSESILKIFFPIRTTIKISELTRPINRQDEHLSFAYMHNLDFTAKTPEYTIRITTNSLGLRDYETPEKTPMTYRFLALGDSFTFGYGVDLKETYCKLLEKNLNRNINVSKKYEVINAGVSGAATDYELAYLKHYGLELKPDHILVFFFHKDFDGNLIGFRNLFYIKDGVRHYYNPVWEGWASRVVITRDKFYEHSDIIKRILLYKASRKYQSPLLPRKQEKVAEVNRKMAAATKKIFNQLRVLTDQEELKLSVIYIPADVFVFMGSEDFLDYTPQGAQVRDLFEYFEKNNIRYLDLHKVFSTMPEEEKHTLYYRYDQHLTPYGHEVAADALEQFLLENYREELTKSGPDNAG